MNERSDYYEILGVQPDASQEQIEAGFRRAASYFHPDRNKSPNAEAMMRLVNEARSVLLDPNQREAYDRLRSEPHTEIPDSQDNASDDAAPSDQSGFPQETQQPPPPAPNGAPNRRRFAWYVGVVAIILVLWIGIRSVGVWKADRASLPPSLQTQAPTPSPTGVSRAPVGTFTLGSTFAEVRAAQGVPSQIFTRGNETWWYYGNSRVRFDASGRVLEWNNTSGNLKVSK